MSEPKEPPCPPGRLLHRERVKKIEHLLPEGKVGAIVIDDTPEHRVWYLHEVAKYQRLTVVDQGVLAPGVYAIKVRKGPSTN